MRVLNIPDIIDKLWEKWYRRRPNIETNYLRSEGVDEDTGEIVGALKVTFQNRSDRKFKVKHGHVVEVNGEHIMISDSFDEFVVEPHDFETRKLTFRYDGENLFTEGKNTGIISYYLKDEKGGGHRKAKVKDEYDPNTI
ncbi:MAG: hypothetical protein ABEK00_02955 [Candidatus Nanohaloarchaea archaeon]